MTVGEKHTHMEMEKIETWKETAGEADKRTEIESECDGAES